MRLLRKFYYVLSPKLRFWVRRLYFLPKDVLNRANNTVPPQGLIYTGSGDFVEQGKAWLTFFQTYGQLKKTHNFLDIGSGIGRIALPLTAFLDGNYRGFDVVKLGVDWCKKHISRQYKNFDFLYVDLFNDLYKSKGSQAAEFSFPYPAHFFDFACCISVFTHILPHEVAAYLNQTNKCMATNGVLVATFFILDKESKALMMGTELDFKYSYDNYALMDKSVKSANVAFEEAYLNDLIANSGFEIVKTFKGYWSGRTKEIPLAFQDILVLKKVRDCF